MQLYSDQLEAGAMKRLTRLAILIFTFAIAPHCSFAAASGEVIISHASMSTSSIPLWVTQRQNFFGKYGIKSKVVWVRGNPAQIASLVSRESLDLVARPNIKNAKDLAGKRFGVQSVGGGVWKTATVWLEHFG